MKIRETFFVSLIACMLVPAYSQTAVVTHPTGSQPITQPSSSTLAVNPLHAVLYVSPTGGDWVAQVNALFAACNYSCVVHTPAGTYTTGTGSIVMHSASQSLSGDGPDLVNITATQPNVIDWRRIAGYANYQPGESISGFTLNCRYTNPSAPTTDYTQCITIGSAIGMNLHDLNLYGPGFAGSSQPPAGGQGLVIQNINEQMERWRLSNVNFGGFAVNIHFLAPVLPGSVYPVITSGGSGYTTHIPTVTFPPPPNGGVTATGTVSIAAGAVQQIIMTNNGSGYTSNTITPTFSYGNATAVAYNGTGTGSYGYGKLSGVWTNQSAGSIGVQIDAGAAVYNTLGWDYQVNSAGTSTSDEYYRIGGTFTGVGFHNESENMGAPFTFAHVLAGGAVQFEGSFNGYGLENTVRVDPGGSFSIVPASNFADTVVGFGSIASYAGTNNTVAVYPTQQLQQENPYVTAQQGYIEAVGNGSAPAGASAPVFVHDPNIPLCYATIPGATNGQPLTNLHTTFCVDGRGNLLTPGGAYLRGPLQTISAFLNNTSRQTPVFSTSSDSTYGTNMTVANTATGAHWGYGVESNFSPAPGAFYISNGTSTPQVQVVPSGVAVSGTVSANIVAFTHPQSTGAVPTVTALAGAGTGATVSISPNSTDSSGYVTVNFGTSPGKGGYLFQVSFASSWTAAPKCWILPASLDNNNGTATAYVNVNDNTTTSFSSRLTMQPSGVSGQNNVWLYKCEQ